MTFLFAPIPGFSSHPDLRPLDENLIKGGWVTKQKEHCYLAFVRAAKKGSNMKSTEKSQKSLSSFRIRHSCFLLLRCLAQTILTKIGLCFFNVWKLKKKGVKPVVKGGPTKKQ